MGQATGPGTPQANPVVGTGPGGGGAGGGYTGLGGILDWLTKGGIGAQAYANMGMGAGGYGGYAVPGAHGALRGLSAAGIEWLQKNLMQANAPHMDSLFAPDVTNADGTVTKGAALTGHDLLMAKLQNSLAGLAPTTYGAGGLDAAGGGLTASDLAAQFAAMQAGGPNMYNRGYDANGWTQIQGGNHLHDLYAAFHNSHAGNYETFHQWRQRQGKKA